MYARVIIDISHQEVNQLYDYIIPTAYEAFLVRGMRVVVPFNYLTRMGYVVEIVEKSDLATKEILDVLDVIPSINEELFMLFDQLKENGQALDSDLFQTLLPDVLKLSYHQEVTLLKPESIDPFFKSLFNKKMKWKLKKKDQIYQYQLSHLRKENIISIDRIYQEKATIKMESVFTFNSDHLYSKIDLYPLILEAFLVKESYTKKELIDLGASESQLKTLLKHEVIKIDQKEVIREIKHYFDEEEKKITLTDEQLHAISLVEHHFNQHQIFLLKGITGSGKTEVYLNLIQKVINKNKQVLLLVPEITLIGPMAKRLKSIFEHVFIYHSGLSSGEKYDQYRQIERYKDSIVLGTRSACFLPLEHLGLIIMDEEHDDAYEQLDHVIYHAKDILRSRANYHQIPLILGSATPSIESMYLANKKDIILLELTKRPNDLKLPEIHFVDMKLELKEKNTSVFSRLLIEKINDRLQKKEQIMILYNRKGYAPFVLCRQCGDVPKCPHCDVSLTYYKDSETLKCHYCGFEKPFQKTCEVCSSDTVKEMGIGIEYVESMLKREVPLAKVIRLDKNVTTTKGSHEKIWNAFENEDYDILLGTQMISKGLDFPKVTLVGVIMADLALKVPSFNADEKAYMLLSQVTGRSGRFYPGEAIIQGYDIKHFAIQSVNQSYDQFYKEALNRRMLKEYPPFKKVSQILIKGEGLLKTYQRAFLLKKKLLELDIDVIGPSQAIIKKIKDQFRFTITLKYQNINLGKVFQIINELSHDDIKINYYPILDIV